MPLSEQVESMLCVEFLSIIGFYLVIVALWFRIVYMNPPFHEAFWKPQGRFPPDRKTVTKKENQPLLPRNASDTRTSPPFWPQARLQPWSIRYYDPEGKEFEERSEEFYGTV